MSSHDDIRLRLAAMRAALERDAQLMAVDMRTFVDWRHHFRRHPWLFCGTAALLGYALIPRRRRHPRIEPTEVMDTTGPREAPPTSKSVNLAGDLATAVATTIGTAMLRRVVSHLVERSGRNAGASLEPRNMARSSSEQTRNEL